MTKRKSEIIWIIRLSFEALVRFLLGSAGLGQASDASCNGTDQPYPAQPWLRGTPEKLTPWYFEFSFMNRDKNFPSKAAHVVQQPDCQGGSRKGTQSCCLVPPPFHSWLWDPSSAYHAPWIHGSGENRGTRVDRTSDHCSREVLLPKRTDIIPPRGQWEVGWGIEIELHKEKDDLNQTLPNKTVCHTV